MICTDGATSIPGITFTASGATAGWTGIPTGGEIPGAYTLNVTATDSASKSLTRANSFTFDLAASPLAITHNFTMAASNTLAPEIMGSTYPQETFTISGAKGAGCKIFPGTFDAILCASGSPHPRVSGSTITMGNSSVATDSSGIYPVPLDLVDSFGDALFET